MTPNSAQGREQIKLDFRAPPPSPIAASRRASSFTNEEVLAEFLEQTTRVPDLILPDRIFPRQKPLLQNVHTLDFDFGAPDILRVGGPVSKIQESLAEIGCFQVINHGISPDLIRSVAGGAIRMFWVLPEKKRMAVRSSEMPFGFEEMSGSDQEEVMSEMSEEFVWGRSYGLKLKMEGVWPNGYSNFSEKMEILALAIEKVAKEIMLALDEITPSRPGDQGQKINGSICHIYKHPHDVPVDRCISALRYDVIRMMIRGPEYPHALSLHICDDSSEFHIYSKKGWVSFTPLPNSLVVTVGDQMQEWSGGQYKHVIGRPIYTSKNEDCISMAFLYSPPTTNMQAFDQQVKKERIISLREQALFAIFFTLTCQFLLHVYNII